MKLRFAILVLVLTVATSGCGVGMCLAGCLVGGVSNLNLTPVWQRIDASWGSADRANGYLLVRREGFAVNWAPISGQVYATGQTVGDAHLVVFSGSATTAIDSALTNGTTYYYQVFSYHSSGYRYTAGGTASGVPGLVCPTGFLAIGANTDVLVSSPFCIAKYEMKNDGSNNAVSQISGAPWVSITRDDNGGTPGAITRCRNIGAGYDLVSNAQWQAVAREVELAQSAGTYLNWSNGTTGGVNAINRGHTDSTPNNALAASLDTDPCFGTSNPSCSNNSVADFTQKRTHSLSSGEAIWDLAGNVWEWVKGDIAAGPPYEGTNDWISQQPWAAGLNHPEMWAPFGSYVSKNSGNYGGLGYGNLGFSGGAVLRGGDWINGVGSGVFTSYLVNGPLAAWIDTGFRCAYVP